MQIDIQAIKAKLPIGRDEEDYKKRSEMFNLFDPNGNGYLSLAEVDKGITDILCLQALFKAKKVIMRAFQAAKDSIKTGSSHGADYIERCEFRLLLVYLRQYFELWVIFEAVDDSDDHRISLDEFVNAVPFLEEQGIVIDNPEQTFNEIDGNHGGKILFDEFSNYCIVRNLKQQDDSQ